MKVLSTCAAGLLLICFSGCGDSYDRMARKMMFDSYRAGGSQPLADVSRPAETLYYLQKYGASAAQKQQAVDAAQRYLLRQTGTSARPTTQSARAKPVSRYIAIPVTQSTRSKGNLDVMLFDTQSRQLVGDEVYDLRSAPPHETEIKFDTYTVQYIGTAAYQSQREDTVD